MFQQTMKDRGFPHFHATAGEQIISVTLFFENASSSLKLRDFKGEQAN